ncbi:hypothetical protein BJX70DRAFT_395707 [Aspergillus crustosus]
MGRALMTRYPVYQTSLREASAYLRTLGVKWDLLDVLQADKGTYPIDNPGYAQPLCTAIQIALVDLLETALHSPDNKASSKHSKLDRSISIMRGWGEEIENSKAEYPDWKKENPDILLDTGDTAIRSLLRAVTLSWIIIVDEKDLYHR